MSKSETSALSLVPTGKEAIEAGKTVGGIALGIIAGHAAVNMVGKINTPIGHGILAAGGFYGAMKVKNPLLKMACAGVAVYGTLRLAGKATAVAAESTSGIAGMIPESVKSALKKFIPTIAGVEEVAGLNGGDFGTVDIDDQGAAGTDGAEDATIEGLGATTLLAA